MPPQIPRPFSHKCHIPIFLLCLTSHNLHVCANLSHGEDSSQCWCSATQHTQPHLSSKYRLLTFLHAISTSSYAFYCFCTSSQLQYRPNSKMNLHAWQPLLTPCEADFTWQLTSTITTDHPRFIYVFLYTAISKQLNVAPYICGNHKSYPGFGSAILSLADH